MGGYGFYFRSVSKPYKAFDDIMDFSVCQACFSVIMKYGLIFVVERSLSTTNMNKFTCRLVFIFFISACVSGCGIAKMAIDESNFDGWIEKVESVPYGTTADAIQAFLGPPQRQFKNIDKDISVLYYCGYGITKGVMHVYWVSNRYGYYAEGSTFDDREAVYWDGRPGLDCYSRIKVAWEYSPSPPDHHFGWTQETYDIDLLRIVTETKEVAASCVSGGIHKLILTGQIGPDSSFSVTRLLERLKPCRAASGRVLIPPTISLSSGGGMLEDGYKLGQALREYGATSVIENGNVCASSCAVAFLGGKQRIVEDEGVILFHAPYYKGQNEFASARVNCDVGDAAINELLDYYQTITDEETGSRLFDRTMTYCSADDGWVVKGGAAAELFGIATER